MGDNLMRFPITIVRLKPLIRAMERNARANERVADALDRICPPVIESKEEPQDEDFIKMTPTEASREDVQARIRQALESGEDPNELIDNYFPEGDGE
jgi:hypothetical protein